MLWQMQNFCISLQYFDVPFCLTMLQPAYLTLVEPKPPAEHFLVECLAQHLKIAGVVSIRFKDLADMLACERRPKLIRLEKLGSELGRGRQELITVRPMTLAAQACGVICGQRSSAVLTAMSAGWRAVQGPPQRTVRTHLIATEFAVGLP